MNEITLLDALIDARYPEFVGRQESVKKALFYSRFPFPKNAKDDDSYMYRHLCNVRGLVSGNIFVVTSNDAFHRLGEYLSGGKFNVKKDELIGTIYTLKEVQL